MTFGVYNVLSDSSCKHDNEACTSCLSYKEMFSTDIFVNGDYLYVLSTSVDQDGQLSSGPVYTAPGYEPPPETRRAGIFRMNLDGTEHEKVYEAELGDIIELRAVQIHTGDFRGYARFKRNGAGFRAKPLALPDLRVQICLELVHITRNARIAKQIFRRTRKKFAGVLYVLQEFLTK